MAEPKSGGILGIQLTLIAFALWVVGYFVVTALMGWCK